MKFSERVDEIEYNEFFGTLAAVAGGAWAAGKIGSWLKKKFGEDGEKTEEAARSAKGAVARFARSVSKKFNDQLRTSSMNQFINWVEQGGYLKILQAIFGKDVKASDKLKEYADQFIKAAKVKDINGARLYFRNYSGAFEEMATSMSWKLYQKLRPELQEKAVEQYSRPGHYDDY